MQPFAGFSCIFSENDPLYHTCISTSIWFTTSWATGITVDVVTRPHPQQGLPDELPSGGIMLLLFAMLCNDIHGFTTAYFCSDCIIILTSFPLNEVLMCTIKILPANKTAKTRSEWLLLTEMGSSSLQHTAWRTKSSFVMEQSYAAVALHFINQLLAPLIQSLS